MKIISLNKDISQAVRNSTTIVMMDRTKDIEVRILQVLKLLVLHGNVATISGPLIEVHKQASRSHVLWCAEGQF